MSFDHTTNTCNRCGIKYPLTDEFWHKDKRIKRGYKSICKSCVARQKKERHEHYSAYRKDYYERNRDSLNQKQREYIERNREQVSQKRKQYYLNHADEIRAKSSQWKKDNPERVQQYRIKRQEEMRDYQRKYRKEHPEVQRKATTKYRLNNPDKIASYKSKNEDKMREYRKKYYTENREKIRETLRKHYEANREKYKEKYDRRRAKLAAAEGFHTEAEIKRLFVSQLGKCFHCDTDLNVTGFERDHWIPLDKSGSDWISNIRLLCPFCNRSKGAKFPHEWSDKYCE